MRTLTREELISETLTRLALRGVHDTMSTREIVTLIAEMIELSREPVPECYEQATPPARCPTCEGDGFIRSQSAIAVLCPTCKG